MRMITSHRPLTSVVAALLLLGSAHTAPAQVSLVLEPHAGSFRWSGEFDRPLEGLLGGRATIEPSRYFGLGIHYARGFDIDQRELTPLQLYGVELAARVGALGSVRPSLLVGLAGTSNVDAAEGVDITDPAPSLRGLVVGGGMRVPLLRRASLELAVRDLLTTVDGEWPWAVREIGDLRHNLAFTGGIGFRIGRDPAPSPPAVAPPVVSVRPADRVIEPAPGVIRDAVSDTFVRIPVPREGEIYIRYGPSEGRVGEPLRSGAEVADARLIRQLIREELGLAGTTAAPAAQLTEAQLRELEARVVRALDDILSRRIREEMDLVRRQLSADIRQLPADRVVVYPGREVPALRQPRERPELTVFGAGSLPAPLQAVVGARADVGPVSPRLRWLRVAPELSIGAGDGGVTVMTTGNVIFHFPALTVGRSTVEPHTMLGLGILGSIGDVYGAARAEGVFNFGVGASLEPSPTSRLRLRPGSRIFVEHQGVDLYRTHRFLLGVRYTR
jgi:hypothetical protein